MVDRQTREKVVSTLLVPGFVGLAALLVMGLLDSFTLHPEYVALAISGLAGFSGIEALYTAASQPQTATALRIRLAGAAAFQLVLLWGLPLLWLLG